MRRAALRRSRAAGWGPQHARSTTACAARPNRSCPACPDSRPWVSTGGGVPSSMRLRWRTPTGHSTAAIGRTVRVRHGRGCGQSINEAAQPEQGGTHASQFQQAWGRSGIAPLAVACLPMWVTPHPPPPTHPTHPPHRRAWAQTRGSACSARYPRASGTTLMHSSSPPGCPSWPACRPRWHTSRGRLRLRRWWQRG